MTDSLPLRIFLATPGDVEDERVAIRTCIEEHNARRHGQTNVVFEDVGWEQVRGTARRPQEAINELIAESHFLIVLLKARWGSDPGSPWGYTSGTEEELFTGLVELGIQDRPMRDVWIAFMNTDDPDDRITALKDQLSGHHAAMYEVLSGVSDLKSKLTQRLEGWEALAETKEARQVELVSSTGREVLRAAKLRIEGEKLADLGQAESARAKLREAAVIGGPTEWLADAKLLARQGDFDGALVSLQRTIDKCQEGEVRLFSSTAAEAFAAQAGIYRRQGEFQDAVGRLEQALTLLPAEQPYAKKVRARILDDLGLAYQKLDLLDDAKSSFMEALAIREQLDDRHGVAQSFVNLARAEVATRDLDKAMSYVDQVLAALRGTPPTAIHANAEALAAQVLLRAGNAEGGIPHASRSLALNRQFNNVNGEAIALLLLAQCHRAVGDLVRAASNARECLDLNTRISNQQGVSRARWLLDEMERSES